MVKNFFAGNPETHKQKLNGKTPLWFKDWYAIEFVPMRVKVNLLMGIATAILIAVVVNVVN